MYSFEYFKKGFDCIKMPIFSNLMFILIITVILSFFFSLFIPILPLLFFGFMFSFFLWDKILASFGENTKGLSNLSITNFISYIVYDIFGWIVSLFNFIDMRVLVVQVLIYISTLYVLGNTLDFKSTILPFIIVNLSIAIYNKIRFSFALPIRLTETDSVMAAFKSSYEKTKGKEVNIFRIYLFYYLFVIFSLIFTILFVVIISYINQVIGLLTLISVPILVLYLFIFNSYVFLNYYLIVKNEKQNEQIQKEISTIS